MTVTADMSFATGDAWETVDCSTVGRDILRLVLCFLFSKIEQTKPKLA